MELAIRTKSFVEDFHRCSVYVDVRKAICDGDLTRCGVEFDQECLDMVETMCGLVSE